MTCNQSMEDQRKKEDKTAEVYGLAVRVVSKKAR